MWEWTDYKLGIFTSTYRKVETNLCECVNFATLNFKGKTGVQELFAGIFVFLQYERKKSYMRKTVIWVLACIWALPVWAEGYQVNVLSAKQTGMGHVGTGMKLGAESMHFNPAGLVYLNQHMDLSVGISAVGAKAKYSHDGYTAETNNPLSTPLYAYAGYKIYDNLAAGISLTTPYGNALKWPKNWAGVNLIQDISLKSFVLQPTMSYRINDKLSVGVGLMLAVGNVKLSRALMSAADFQTIGGLIGRLPDAVISPQEKAYITGIIRDTKVPPAAATLEGKAHVRAGFNIGVLYDISEKVSVGLSYRSKIKMKVKEGEAKLDYANRTIEELMGVLGQKIPQLAVPKYDQGTFHAQLPLPSNTTLGVSYRPTARWELALDLQYVGWNAYDSLNVYFNEEELGISPIKAKKDYRNTIIVRAGAQYKTTDRLFLRAGLYFDESPIRKNNYNPETPGMNKLGMSAGCSFEPYKNLQIDFAFLYIQGIGRDGSYTSKNIVTGQEEKFDGHYNSSAITASLGLAYKF